MIQYSSKQDDNNNFALANETYNNMMTSAGR